MGAERCYKCETASKSAFERSCIISLSIVLSAQAAPAVDKQYKDSMCIDVLYAIHSSLIFCNIDKSCRISYNSETAVGDDRHNLKLCVNRFEFSLPVITHFIFDRIAIATNKRPLFATIVHQKG